MAKIISFNQVNKKFKNTVALDNVSFEVSEGEIFGFLVLLEQEKQQR